MNTTINYSLKKPEGTDIVNIDDLNYNMDVLDTKLKEVDNKASNITAPVTSVNTKTGAVVLSASDIKAADGTSVESHLADMGTHISDGVKHITAEERTSWNNNISTLTVNAALLNLKRSISMGGMI